MKSIQVIFGDLSNSELIGNEENCLCNGKFTKHSRISKEDCYDSNISLIGIVGHITLKRQCTFERFHRGTPLIDYSFWGDIYRVT